MTYTRQIKFFSQALEAYVESPHYLESRIKIKCHGVFYRAELYKAPANTTLHVGQRVRMVGICENVALIML